MISDRSDIIKSAALISVAMALFTLTKLILALFSRGPSTSAESLHPLRIKPDIKNNTVQINVFSSLLYFWDFYFEKP